MSNTIFLWSQLVLPWISIFFMEKLQLKRFMPVALFTTIILIIISEFAYVHKWWIIKEYIFSIGYITNIPTTFGLFIIGTLWIFYFTYSRFWLYLLTNIVIDSIFFLFISKWYVHRGIIEFGLLNKWQIVIFLTLPVAILIYLYQLWQDEAFLKRYNR